MLKESFKNSSYFVQLTMILFFIVGGFTIFLTLGILFASLIFQINISSVLQAASVLEVSNINMLKFLQSMYSVGLFVFPAIVAAWLFGNTISEYLKLNKSPNFIFVLLAISIVFVLLPAINFLVSWNESISLPDSMKELEKWMQQMENDAKKASSIFLRAKSFTVYLSNVIVLAMIPAIGEELLFRGVLQKLFHNWSKKIHIAIWLSAFLFSALHMQFYGFVPRMLLGALFGYLFYWSGNLWIPIIAHFFNNFIAVTIFYLNNNVTEKIENTGIGNDAYFYIVPSLILFSVLLLYFYKLNTKTKINETDDNKLM